MENQNQAQRIADGIKSLGIIVGQVRLYKSPYEQYRDLNGQSATVLRIISEASNTHDLESLPVYVCEIDGKEYEVLPEEIAIVLYPKYSLVADIPGLGTQTYEDYDDLNAASAALESIRTNGYHLAENDDSMTRITFEEFDEVTFYLDQELWGEDGVSHYGFKSLSNAPVYLKNNTVVS